MKSMYESNYHTYTSRTYQALSHIPQQNHIEVIQLLCYMNHCLFYEEYKKFDEQAAKLYYFIELAEGLIEEEQLYNKL